MTRVSAPAPRFDAVVIGASAGGVEVLSLLLPALSADFGGAVMVVLHLPRDRNSLLVDLFASRCALRVKEAEDKEPVVPGTVYFAAPDYHLLVDHGPVLALSCDEPVLYSRPSIDVLFESAADVYGTRLLGIVLSGASEDGAQGLAAVHEAGGFCIAQDPGTARVAIMPAAALLRSGTDQVMTPEEMARFLVALR